MCPLTGLEFRCTLWKVPATVMKGMGTENKRGRVTRRTRGEENDASDLNLKLVLYNVLENPAIDDEWLRVVEGSVSSGLLGSILVLEVPVPFEFL